MFRQFFEDDKGSGGGTAPFAGMAQLKDDLKTNADIAAMGSFDGLARGFLDRGVKLADTEKKLAGMVAIPGADAKPEEVAAFYDRLGRPKTADEYKLENPELPEGVKLNPELTKTFVKTAHELGLTQNQAAALGKLYNDTQVQAFNAAKEAQAQAVVKAGDALKTEWKDDFAANMEIVRRAFTTFGGDDFAKYMNESGIGNDPRVMKTFFNIGKAMMDDKLVSGEYGKTTPKREKGVLEYKEMK